MSLQQPAPYPAATMAKGWRFELDHERIRKSDTWALAPAEVRPWLLMLWMTAWEQTPCGSLPASDELIAAHIGMPLKTFAKCRAALMRGWWLADDGRLYHKTVTERVQAMLDSKNAEKTRKAEWRKRKAEGQPSSPPPVPDMSRGTTHGQTPDSHGIDDTRTSTGTSTNTSEDKSSDGKPSDRDAVFANGVPLLTVAGVAEKNARSMLAMLCKTHGDGAVAQAIAECAKQRPVEPVSWLQAVLKPGKQAKPESFRERDERVARERVAAFAPGVAARAPSSPTPFTIESEARHVAALEGH